MPDDASDFWVLGALNEILDAASPTEISDEELSELEAAGSDDDIWDETPDDLRGDGAGYNPNRASNGRFAAGSHNPRSKGQGRAPKFDDHGHRELISHHKTEEKWHRNRVIEIKQEQAKLRESAKGKSAKDRAEIRVQHRELAKLSGIHREIAGENKDKRVAASKDLANARAENTIRHRVQRVVVNDANRKIVSSTPLVHGAAPADLAGRTKLHSAQMSPEAQAALREHHNVVIAQYGLHNRDAGLVGAHVAEVRNSQGMGRWAGGVDGAAGLHWRADGRVALNIETADGVHSHSSVSDTVRLGQEAHSGSREANSKIDGYHVSTHEALHGHGPEIYGFGPHLMLDEMTTEMSARRITADVHGVGVGNVRGGYDGYITPVVSKLSELSGSSHATSMRALAHASLEFKRRGGQVDAKEGLHDVGVSALRRLGVADSDSHSAMLAHMLEISARNP